MFNKIKPRPSVVFNSSGKVMSDIKNDRSDHTTNSSITNSSKTTSQYITDEQLQEKFETLENKFRRSIEEINNKIDCLSSGLSVSEGTPKYLDEDTSNKDLNDAVEDLLNDSNIERIVSKYFNALSKIR